MENSEKRIAVLAVIVTDTNSVDAVNAALHEYGAFILGRLGLPLRERGINTISLVMDAPVNSTNALTGKLGALAGVSAKALFAKLDS